MNNVMDMSSTIGHEGRPTDGPSVGFIYAISEFLETDPKDLLVELGYKSYPGAAPELATTASQGAD